jgi:hypothetical protein
MEDIFKCYKFSAYQLSKVSSYLRKAYSILDEMDLINAKIDNDFFSLLDFCNQQALIKKNKMEEEK